MRIGRRRSTPRWSAAVIFTAIVLLAMASQLRLITLASIHSSSATNGNGPSASVTADSDAMAYVYETTEYVTGIVYTGGRRDKGETRDYNRGGGDGDGGRNDICYIHVGKTGGTTLNCMIRHTLNDPVCIRRGASHIPNESEISRRVVRSVHNQRPTCTADESVLLTVRDPVSRVASTFLYEHPANVRKRGFEPMPHTVRLFEECYQSLDDLATDGLGAHPRDAECGALARESVLGREREGGHNYWNYEKYAIRALHFADKLYVVRTEHLWDDWNALNARLLSSKGHRDRLGGEEIEGGDADGGTSPHSSFVGESLNVHSEGKPAVTDRYLSDLGRRQLCAHLCRDIQFYKAIIWTASNLGRADKLHSMGDLKEACPLEGSETTTLSECDES